ncbi:threonine synthase [Fodinibius sediminis]|uniref:Threonine synthase n=1 Tax=Fodinibius sediminis TaxID=1214077 RepID=A0A521CBB3_9BACT|nr:threonine synthase [Fodinibius sediminis]SMO56723.1 L-threonine synthase [Fodinibius sediminis]
MSKIEFVSTRGKAPSVRFLEAMEQGLAPDGGLYMPDHWPSLLGQLWNEIRGKSIQDIGLVLSQAFIPEVPGDELTPLVEDALSFDAPLVHLHDNTYVLELFHGPTLAFKDFGARFMARMMSYQARRKGRRMVILVATSGDTGSAVGRAFEGVEGIDVCLLYPSGQVSKLQEQQLTTIGNNVTALEVDGTFDDCQKMVKDAFLDAELREDLRLSSANSINIARLLPQMFYYGRALAQYEGEDPVHFCVPSGNFGNLTAGMMAARTKMPAHQFIAGTNVNDVVPSFLTSGSFVPRPSRRTISSAMDVGNPSNLERIRALYPEMTTLNEHLWAASFDDEATKKTIRKGFREFDYIFDPHTAVGYLAARKYRKEKQSDHPVVILSTAHPAKFRDIIEPVIEHSVTMPDRLAACLEKEKQSIELEASFQALKTFLNGQY